MFSVLVPVYFKENPKYVDECLASLFTQTLLPSEIVLVKDGKVSAEIESVIEKYIRRQHGLLKVVALEKNSGMATALNEGIKACSHEWIARMDSDDVCTPDRFEKQFSFLQKNPEVRVLGSCIAEYDEDMRKKIAERKVPELNDEIVRYAQYRSPVNHMTVIFRKTDVQEAGLYQHIDKRTNIEDYVLWCTLIRNGHIFHNLQENLVHARTGINMISKRGGWSYFSVEYKYLKMLKKQHFFKGINFYKNVMIRFAVRLLPQRLIAVAYSLIRR